MITPSLISPYTSIISFTIGFPTAIATYYQAWKARQESRELREGLARSGFCLEFVDLDGATVNMASLDSLHSLPQVGEVVLLPGVNRENGISQYQAFRISEMEHLYAPTETRSAVPGQAHLVKIVAKVVSLTANGLPYPVSKKQFSEAR